jgi:basic membrane protein A and related proteins
VLTTFEFTELAQEFAEANPDQPFILIDACPDEPAPNLHCGVFREYEGTYLLGVMAGSLTETGDIGSVVALDIPFLSRFSEGFAMGAESVNDGVSHSAVYIGGDNPFSDPARAKEQALALDAQGVDHMLAAGSGSNGGVFEAAREEGFYAYGVDVNQCPDEPGVVVDNILKRVDVVVESLIDLILEGKPRASTPSAWPRRASAWWPCPTTWTRASASSPTTRTSSRPSVRLHDAIVSGELTIEDPMLAGS